MIDNENPSTEYIKGFNYGYSIAEHIPDLAQQLSTATGGGDKIVGLKAGIEQYNYELDKKLTPQILKADKHLADQKEINKDDIEKEID